MSKSETTGVFNWKVIRNGERFHIQRFFGGYGFARFEVQNKMNAQDNWKDNRIGKNTFVL